MVMRILVEMCLIVTIKNILMLLTNFLNAKGNFLFLFLTGVMIWHILLRDFCHDYHFLCNTLNLSLHIPNNKLVKWSMTVADSDFIHMMHSKYPQIYKFTKFDRTPAWLEMMHTQRNCIEVIVILLFLRDSWTKNTSTNKIRSYEPMTEQD